MPMSAWKADCLKWRGTILTGVHGHWCMEWDGLPVDETCIEWPCCLVAYRTFPRKLKKWAKQGFPNRPARYRFQTRFFREQERALNTFREWRDLF